MAHEIETAFFYANAAWHRKGNVVQEKPKTTAHAMQLASMGWTVSKYPTQVVLPDGSVIDNPGRYATVRDTDHRVLGNVGEEYDILQNLESFAFFDPFVADGRMYLDAAGSLRMGSRVFILARAEGMSADIVPGDRVDQHLLLWTSHDGSAATGIMWTPIRVVCANTLRAATQDGKTKDAIRIPHTVGQRVSLQLVQDAVDVARRSFATSVEAFMAMQQTGMNIDGLEQYVRQTYDRLVGVDENGEIVNAKPPRAFEHILESWEFGEGADIPGVKGTVWGAYNAVTDFIDHSRGRQGKDENTASFRNRQLDNSWFGPGAKLRQRAFEAAMALVN